MKLKPYYMKRVQRLHYCIFEMCYTLRSAHMQLMTAVQLFKIAINTLIR